MRTTMRTGTRTSPMAREDVLDRLAAPLALISRLHPEDVPGCERALKTLPLDDLEAALRSAHQEGWLTPREGGGVRFGRLAKPGADTHGYSVDVVEMCGPARGPNGLAAHTHLTGEFDLCIPLSGSPAFDGRRDRWVVFPPGSRHVPTVTGGTMLVVYFVKDGAIRFE